MAAARHPMPPEIASLSLDEIAERYIGRFRDKTPDWEAFEDAKIEGYRRAQHRFIGAGGSGKHDDPSVIPPRAFTLSIIYCPPGLAPNVRALIEKRPISGHSRTRFWYRRYMPAA